MKQETIEAKVDLTLDQLNNVRNFDFEKKKPIANKKNSKKKPQKLKPYFTYIADKTDALINGKDDKSCLPINYNKNILLAFAFNIALKNYQNVRNNCDKNIIPLFELVNSTEKEALKSELKKGYYESLETFKIFEPKLYRVLDTFRNFHSHYFHNTGIVSFKDDFNSTDNLEALSVVKEWLQLRFEDTKTHMLNSLATKLEEENKKIIPEENEEKEIKKVKECIEEFKFYNQDNTLTEEAQLFFAATFMQKSQINYVLKKWKGIKLTKGHYKQAQTFFTKAAIPDKYAIASELQNIYKFRNIMSNLSLMPYTENPSLQIFYETIKEQNERINEKIENEDDKTKRDELVAQKINIRKNKKKLVFWLLEYLVDRDLFNGFKIAYHKISEDYKKADLENKTLVEFKQAIKNEHNPSRKQELNNKLKAYKRNFKFENADGNQNNYCIKKNNAILQYELNINNNSIAVQISVSAHYLLKWVFIDLLNNEKGKVVADNLKSFITTYCNTMYRKDIAAIKKEIANNKTIKNLPLKSVLPKSIQINYSESEATTHNNEIIDKLLEEKLKDKIAELQYFAILNEAEKYPYRFASRRKINYILEYNHFKFIKEVYSQTNKTDKEQEDIIRHAAPREHNYQDTYKYIRFYGRFKDTKEFKTHFSTPYYNAINKMFSKCNALEDLFNHVFEQYRKYLQKIKITDTNKIIYAKVLKLKRVSETHKIETQLKTHFFKAISISGDILDINDYINTDNYKLSKKEFKTNYADIRKILEDKEGISNFTNIDFMIQHIFPLVLKKKDEEESININTVYKNLLKLKTEELILWNIAKYFWKKEYGEKPKLDVSNTKNNNIFQKNIFNTFYKRDFEIKYADERATANPNQSITVKVSPKKFDDEYQYLNKELIQHYLKWYLPNSETSINFIDLNKNIKNQLYFNLDDIYLVLENEKILWQEEQTNTLKQKLIDKYEDNSKVQNDFYLSFEELVSYLTEEQNKANLKQYRNHAMHYQLQNPIYYKVVQEQLIKKIEEYKQ